MSYEDLAREIEAMTQMVKKETRALQELLSVIRTEENRADTVQPGEADHARFEEELDEKLKVQWGRMDHPE